MRRCTTLGMLGLAATLLGSMACGGSPPPQQQPTVIVVNNGGGSWRPRPDAVEPGEEWVGEYVCPQGPTGLRVRVTRVDGPHVDGVFAFRAPNNVIGEFELAGVWNQASRQLVFEPGAWLIRPAGWETVGMDGSISPDGRYYVGRIRNPNCAEFRLQRGR